MLYQCIKEILHNKVTEIVFWVWKLESSLQLASLEMEVVLELDIFQYRDFVIFTRMFSLMLEIDSVFGRRGVGGEW